MRFVGFIGPSYKLNSVNVDCQRCINLFPELDEIGTGKDREVASLVSTPGLRLLGTVGIGPIRGTYYSTKGQFFVASKNKLYRVNAAWVATEVGTLLTSTGPVSMADDGYNLIAVDGLYGYDWNFSSSTFAQITDSNFLGADRVTTQDGYFIFNQPSTSNFFLSNIASGTATDMVTFSGDVGIKSANSDNIVTVISDHRNLWLFGSQSTEVWYDSANNDFPFQRIEGAYMEMGLAAAFSIAKVNGSFIWLGTDKEGQGCIYQAQGYQPQRISTHAVELAIQSLGDLSGAVAYTYQQNGHHFYCLNITTTSTTWVFDTLTNMWHERAYLSNGSLQRHRAQCHAFAYSTHVVGDYQNANIYELSTATYSDNGDPIIRKRVSPHLSQDDLRVFYSSFQLDIEAGTGLDGLAQGTDPQAMLQFSDDGGHTWSNEKWTSFGKIGHTKHRAIWRQLGSARNRVFSISISDPVKVTLIGADLGMMQGRS